MMSTGAHYRSQTIRAARENPVRALLSSVLAPNTVKFSGGFPYELYMPFEEVGLIDAGIRADRGLMGRINQYGPTEGLPTAKQASAEYLAKTEGRLVQPEAVTFTIGSQMVLYISGMCLGDPGDNIIVGRPTYLGGINAFALARLNMIGVELDDQGMNVDEIESLLQGGLKIRFVYVIPDFQNPSGITMSLVRRQQLLRLAYEYDFMIVEDSPYRQLCFSGEPIPSIWSLDERGQRVIFMITTSKIIFSMRLAICTAPQPVIDDFHKALASILLCVWGYPQELWTRIVQAGWLDNHVARISAHYLVKKNILVSTLREACSQIPGFHLTDPEGGLFSWMTLPEVTASGRPVDTSEMVEMGKRDPYRVVFVPGYAFYSDGTGRNKARLNFSHPSEEEIISGAERLSRLVLDYYAL